MDKTICVSVAWEEPELGCLSLYLKTHSCKQIDLAYITQARADKFMGSIDVHEESYSGKTPEEVKQKIEIALFGQPATLSGLPELTQQPILNVDMTPNDELVLRILKAYRTNCDCKGIAEPPSKLIDLMNEANDKRAKLLDRAIEELSK